GHNLSNASTEGYSRQRVELSPTEPLYRPQLNREQTPGQIGQGIDIARIEGIRDQILEGRIVKQANGEGYWEARDKYLLMVEQIYNEPTELSIRGLMDKFWNAWQELSLNPSDGAPRKAVLQRGEALIDGIHERYYSLKNIREMIDLDIRATVTQVNGMLNDIAALNEQILKVTAMGDNPNDLFDRRGLLVKKLSEIVDITVDLRDPDEFTIHTGGRHLVQGRLINALDVVPDPADEGYSRVVWKNSAETAHFQGGKLAALVELRDEDVRGEIQKLDIMTINFIDMVNSIHRQGYGLNGQTGQDFFMEYPFINNLAGNYDRNGDGEYDSSYIFRITGINTLKPQSQIGLQGTITISAPAGNISIDYYPTDTVEDVIKRINNMKAEVVAELDRQGRLTLKATPAEEKENPDFVIRHVEDSDQFLVGYAGILAESGPAGAFTWDRRDSILSLRGGGLDYAVAPLAHPSGWIEVSPAIKQDTGTIASGFGENGRPALPGDGSAALAIAALRNRPVMIGQVTSFDEFFSNVVADAGLKGEEAARALETQKLIMKELSDMRESISGVNIDEELAQMIKFQHGYAAAARFVSIWDKMLETIINRLGV
ncbi:MAG: flagellar hook-associated protein FlgK, partial [Spirochaetota bacterium]